MRFPVLALSLGLVLMQTAQGGIKVELEYEPDVANGKAIFSMCATCHLPEGQGAVDGTFPQLAGQHENVLVQQLLNIRQGKRDNPLMFPFVQQRTLGGYQELVDVVAYISTLPMTREPGRGHWPQGTKEHAQGKKLYEKNCSQCHGEDGEGNNVAKFPKLRGQHYAYVLRQLRNIKAGLRDVNPVMKGIAEGLSDQELEKVANYASFLLPMKVVNKESDKGIGSAASASSGVTNASQSGGSHE